MIKHPLAVPALPGLIPPEGGVSSGGGFGVIGPSFPGSPPAVVLRSQGERYYEAHFGIDRRMGFLRQFPARFWPLIRPRGQRINRSHHVTFRPLPTITTTIPTLPAASLPKNNRPLRRGPRNRPLLKMRRSKPPARQASLVPAPPTATVVVITDIITPMATRLTDRRITGAIIRGRATRTVAVTHRTTPLPAMNRLITPIRILATVIRQPSSLRLAFSMDLAQSNK